MKQHQSRRSTHRTALRLSFALTLLAGALYGCDGSGGGTGGSGGGGTGGSGGGTGGSGGGTECNPVEVPSLQTVNVEIENATAETRYLITGCFDCDTVRVDLKGDLDYVPLPMSVTAAEKCGCECAAPPEPYATSFLRIDPGAKVSASWDARTLDTCVATVDCGAGETADVTSAAFVPAPPGDYRVSFGVIQNLPAECVEMGGTGMYECDVPAVPGLDPGGGFYPVEVTLAESGNVSATLVIQ